MRTAILCALTLSAVAEAGVRLDEETVDTKGISGELRMELQENKVRIDRFTKEASGSGGVNRIPGETMIFDGTEVFIIDHRSKTYLVLDPGRAKAVRANLPPQIRAQIENATTQANYSGKVTFKKSSGKKDSVAGFACTNYVQSEAGVERATVCIASWKTVPVKKEDLAGLVRLGKAMGLTEEFGKATLINPDEWLGFPLSSQANDGQVSRLKSAARTSIPDNEFQPPSDYTRKATPAVDRGGTP